MNAILLPSGDHTGPASRSMLGDIHVIVFLPRSYTPTMPWSPRLLVKARRVPSGDQASEPSRPMSRTTTCGLPLPSNGMSTMELRAT